MCILQIVAEDTSDARLHGLISDAILMQLRPALSTFVYGHGFSVARGIRDFDTSGFFYIARGTMADLVISKRYNQTLW